MQKKRRCLTYRAQYSRVIKKLYTMKKILLSLTILMCSLSSIGNTVQNYLNDLKNHPDEITELQAKQLMDHPGTSVVVDNVYSNSKMYTNTYCLTPFDTSIHSANYKKEISYKNRWVIRPFIEFHSSNGLVSMLLFRVFFIFSFLFIVGPKLYYLCAYLFTAWSENNKSYKYKNYLSRGGTKSNENEKFAYNATLFVAIFFIFFVAHTEAPQTPRGATSFLLWLTLPPLTGLLCAGILKIFFRNKEKVQLV